MKEREQKRREEKEREEINNRDGLYQMTIMLPKFKSSKLFEGRPFRRTSSQSLDLLILL